MTWSTSEVAVCCSNELGEVGRALAQLLQQSRILDGDDGLGGEILYQLDLLVGEWPYFLPKNDEGADILIVLQHRHTENCPRTNGFDEGHDAGIAHKIGLVCPHISNVSNRLGIDHAD